MRANKNRSNSVNDTVGLGVDNVALGSGSVEQAVQDRYQATVSLIAGYPGQSSLNLLQDNGSNQVDIKKKGSHQNVIMTANNKTNHNTLRNSLNYGVLNARSINKTETVIDFIPEHHLDILCITETWLQSDDSFTTNHVTPCGYSIVSSPRLNRQGGGLAVLIKNDLHSKRQTSVCFSTFEVLLVQVTSSSKSFAIATIYRPPGPLGNFLSNLSDFLSTLVAKYNDFILAGDFNIHVDIASDELSKKLIELLKNFGLRQHVKLPTHNGGHILDLVISRIDTELVRAVSVMEGISDHHGILVDLTVTCQKRSVVKKTFHQFKKLDMVKFQQDILSSELYTNPSLDVDVLAEQYHRVTSNLVSIHAPVITRTVTCHPPAPWYTQEIALARQKRHQLERC